MEVIHWFHFIDPSTSNVNDSGKLRTVPEGHEIASYLIYVITMTA